MDDGERITGSALGGPESQGHTSRIADAIGVSRETVNRERAGDTNVSPGDDRKVAGKDGREYPECL